MSALAKLKLVTATRGSGGNAQQQRRNKLCGKIEEQLEVLRAKREGNIYAPKRIKFVTDDVTGERRAVESVKRVKEWFWKNDDNTYTLQIRYGSKVMELAKDKNAVIVADLDELAKTLATIKAAVQVGELDAQIEGAATKLRAGFGK